MSDTTANNKRIVKNTLFLYFRMIVVMGVGLYTVRAILQLLGVVDYGIYNVVGGVVSMFTFLNGTLSTSSQRYFSIELAKGDIKRLNQWFSLNITVFTSFVVLFIVFAETIGLWFVNTKLNIPQERMFAANAIYQLSIFTFCIHFYSIPYNALIIAHEKMKAFAYISIIEAFLKLAIVLLLGIISWDKLILYGILMFLASGGITLAYIVYNRKHFDESRYYFYWNKKEFLDLISFSGWHFFGTFSVSIRSQGINILLNLFFNPVVNAARAVSYQLYNAIVQLSNNFFTAVKPQIYKYYAQEDYDGLYKLIMRSTFMCSFLVSILAFPFLLNTSYILELWLKDVPEYTVMFSQLVFINGIIDSTGGPSIAAALATGKIKKYQLYVATLNLLNLPISYFVLKIGMPPHFVLYVSIGLSLISSFVKGYLLYSMIKFPYKQFYILLLKIVFASIGIWVISYLLFYNSVKTIPALFGSSIIIFSIVCAFYLFFIFNREDRFSLIKHFMKYATHK